MTLYTKQCNRCHLLYHTARCPCCNNPEFTLWLADEGEDLFQCCRCHKVVRGNAECCGVVVEVEMVELDEKRRKG